MKKFPFYRQLNAKDCGPVCLRMISKFYGKHITTETLRNLSHFNKEGTSILGLSDAAEKIGLQPRGVLLNFKQLSELSAPCIIHWNSNHFVVLINISKNFKKIKIADPAKGIKIVSTEEFLGAWCSIKDETSEAGIALLLNPGADFRQSDDELEPSVSWGGLLNFFADKKKQLLQVFLAVIMSSVMLVLFPFLTQLIVDVGVRNQDLNFISLIIIAQLVLIFSRTIIEFIRNEIILRLAAKFNLTLLSDFWIKVTKLPLSYFDIHHTGDTLQRINDHKKIQEFLTGTSITTFFSLLSLLILSTFLYTYNPYLFLVFVVGNLLYLTWISFFLKIRRKINYSGFYLYSKENDATLELVQGMQEIRLNNAEYIKRWNWENIQTTICKLQFKQLRYTQWQQVGAVLLTQGKDLLMLFLAVKFVINGSLSLGGLVAVQYIVGQLSNPIEEIINFIQTAQDAKISLERINEVHKLEDERTFNGLGSNEMPEHKNISINNLSFSYPGASHQEALSNINLEISEGKITAIVGSSGSGKTTLIKMILKYYDTYKGTINLGDMNFNNINAAFWRSRCGSVLQDGFIFNESIARNIAVGDETIDLVKLTDACRVANILPFINSLAHGFQTNIGANGMGISQGQRQRLLIARAIYKNPEYIFFDEATNALDSNNERIIVENLRSVFKNRTVIVVAHRLSTIKNADKIVVMDKGTIVEEGTHRYLLSVKGYYYNLVRNQVELEYIEDVSNG